MTDLKYPYTDRRQHRIHACLEPKQADVDVVGVNNSTMRITQLQNRESWIKSLAYVTDTH